MPRVLGSSEERGGRWIGIGVSGSGSGSGLEIMGVLL